MQRDTRHGEATRRPANSLQINGEPVATTLSGTMKKTEIVKAETPTLTQADLDKVTGGNKIIQMKNDMQKGIIANFRV